MNVAVVNLFIQLLHGRKEEVNSRPRSFAPARFSLTVTLKYVCTESSRERRLRVVSNFGDGDCGAGSLRVASPRTFARARVYFACPTIVIAKIRDYSQSSGNDFRQMTAVHAFQQTCIPHLDPICNFFVRDFKKSVNVSEIKFHGYYFPSLGNR